MPRSAVVVEDDDALRRVISLVLRGDGFEVAEAATGAQGLALATDGPVDVVLLDLMLPDVPGVDVCRELRRRSTVPVVVVTARAGSRDVVEALEAGADDYVTKPFVAKVLTARVQAVLRRSTPQTEPLHDVELGDLVLRRGQGDVVVRGEPVPLTRTEQALLEELAGRPGQAVGRTELLRRVWGREWFGDDRVVDVHVHRLRRKLEQDPARPVHLLTVRGRGYRLAGDV
ncbi:response regulator transcription factor [Pseudokineococcus sp. 1T1Z-3]|uniref:response regulator transcription factor n=1 Tax=Pseudokineococcus sp. 1T1Z-3 TaxID=3132745 RepID=UPI00309AFD26